MGDPLKCQFPHTKGSRDCQGHRNWIISESVFADRGGFRLWARNVGCIHNSTSIRNECLEKVTSGFWARPDHSIESVVLPIPQSLSWSFGESRKRL